jgi:glycosyltransferase involved in cell wall biosynthesis
MMVRPAPTEGAPDVSGPHAPGRGVCLFVFNHFTHDSRVLNVARTFAGRGDEVRVVAIASPSLPADEMVDGYRVLRLPFDPLYYRLWDGRTRFTRPWEHPAEIRSWLRDQPRALSTRPVRTAGIAALLGLLTPWFAMTVVYHAVARAMLHLLRRARLKARWSPSRWLDQRYRRVLFAAPAAVRVATWTRAVLAAFNGGSLAPADVWHANDLETLPAALLLRRRYGGSVIYDSHELYLEMPGPRRMGRLRRWLLRQAEGVMTRSADAVVTINDPIAAELEQKYGVARPVVIHSYPPLWSPGDRFTSPLRPAIRELGVADDLGLVTYHGAFQAGRGIEQLLEAALPIDTLAVALLGDGPLAAWIRERAASPAWHRRLALLPVVPPDELLAWLAGADLSACLIQPVSRTYLLSSPNKLFQAIAARVPVLATKYGPIGEIVERYGVGVACDPTDVAQVSEGLRRLLAMSPGEVAGLRENARRAHEETLNWEHEAGRLEALYGRLAGRTSRARSASAA